MQITVDYKSARWAQLLDPKYRYIFIKGGRSSSKSWETANYLIERSISEQDLKIVCLREVQKSIDKSSKSLIDNRIKKFGLSPHYKSIQSEVRKKLADDAGHFYFQGMNDLTADNIKSLEDYKIAWFEEAQNCTHNTLKTLRPTIRAEGSQIIFTWNPKFPDDAIEELCNDLRNEPDVLVLHINYDQNPFLTAEVLREIEIDRKKYPDDFDHIWLGQYDTTFHGHYYAKLLEDAKAEGRITEVPRKAGVDIVTFWDLGRADATAIWVAQVVGLQVRIIDHIADNFQHLDYFADWIKQNDYNGLHVLPHDAAHERLAKMGSAGSIQAQLRDLGLTNSIIQKAGSLDATRKLAKNLIREAWIDETRCKDGLNALRKEKSEKDRNGMWRETHEHDSAAAFRYMAMHLNKTPPVVNKPDPYDMRRNPYGAHTSETDWMGN
jgi:phage terminase large subunit